MTLATATTPAFPLAVKMVMVDLDGTLIHTAPDLAASANRMLKDLGRPQRELEIVSTWIGNGVPRLVKRALTGEMMAEPEAALYERGLALFQKHYAAGVSELSRPFPGVVEGLTALASRITCPTIGADAAWRPPVGINGPERLPLAFATRQASARPRAGAA